LRVSVFYSFTGAQAGFFSLRAVQPFKLVFIRFAGRT